MLTSGGRRHHDVQESRFFFLASLCDPHKRGIKRPLHPSFSSPRFSQGDRTDPIAPRLPPNFCSPLPTLMPPDPRSRSVCATAPRRGDGGGPRDRSTSDTSGEESSAGGFETPARPQMEPHHPCIYKARLETLKQLSENPACLKLSLETR